VLPFLENLLRLVTSTTSVPVVKKSLDKQLVKNEVIGAIPLRAKYCIEWTCGIEDGYSNNPLDPGGETKFGISKRSYPLLDIKNLTLAKAQEIYFKDYWLTISADKLPQPLDLFVFDASVNHGCSAAISMLQRVCRVPQDGKIGPQTLSRVKSVLPHHYLTERAIRYAHDKNLDTFGRGWFNRLFEILLSTRQ